jgi:hypothetical protein
VPRSVSRNRDMRAPPRSESAFGGGEAAIAGVWGAAAAVERGEQGSGPFEGAF